MLFMIIERFKDQDMLPVYKKLQHSGRMMPDAERLAALLKELDRPTAT